MTATPGNPPRVREAVRIAGEDFEEPFASHADMVAWQRDLVTEYDAQQAPLRETGGYRDNPRREPAVPTEPPRPPWWRRALCALGIHTGDEADCCGTVCCSCCPACGRGWAP